MGPGVAGDLVTLTIHSLDNSIPTIVRIVNWAFGFVGTSRCIGFALEGKDFHA